MGGKDTKFIPNQHLLSLRLSFFILIFFLAQLALAAHDTAVLRIHFLYGSKPKWKHRHVEKRKFGGLHGGHVTLQMDGLDYGFERSGGFHIFSNSRKKKAKFWARHADSVAAENAGSKTVTFLVPLTGEQATRIRSLHQQYCTELPYDYAFFGMRCAASVREILGQAGVLPVGTRTYYIRRFFYPRPLRRYLFRVAEERGYAVIRTQGSGTRRWEKD